MENREILRQIVQADVGAPGSGLLSPEQFEAWWALAETVHPWQALMSTERRTAHTGGIPRIDFGDDILRAATEAVDSGTFSEPAHDFVAYAMTKMRAAFMPSAEVLTQNAAGPSYEDQIVEGFNRAYVRALQRLAWLGDTALVDPGLNINNGWLVQITAGGNLVNGALINGGNIHPDHFFEAYETLPDAWKQRSDEMRWAISPTKKAQLWRALSQRATGVGDQFLTEPPDDFTIAGIRTATVPSLGNQVVLTSPMNTTVITDPTNFSFRRVSEGLTVVARDVVAYIGFSWADFVLREAEGTALIQNLNP